MTQKYISVKIEDHLKDVVKELIHKKLDCAFVFNESSVLVGIFTTIDALKVLLEKIE